MFIVHYGALIYQFRRVRSGYSLLATIQDMADETSGDGFQLKKATIFSTSTRAIASFGEDLLQFVISCSTLGYMGTFSSSWVVNVISSGLSMAYFWSTLAEKFIYGHVFTGLTKHWFQGIRVLVFIGLLSLTPALFRVNYRVDCSSRPHSISSDNTLDHLKECGVLNHVCLVEPFDYSQIMWKTTLLTWK